MVSGSAAVASGATAGRLPVMGRCDGGGRWLVPLATAVVGRSSAAGVRHGQLLRVMMASATLVRMSALPMGFGLGGSRWR
jgi:hypothetical protein